MFCLLCFSSRRYWILHYFWDLHEPDGGTWKNDVWLLQHPQWNHHVHGLLDHVVCFLSNADFFFLIVHEFVCLPLQANTMNASVFAHAATGYIALTFSKYHIWGQRQWLIMLTLRKMQKKGEKKDQVSWEEKNRVCLSVCEGHWQLERERERERFSWDILKYVVCRVVASQSLEQCY